MKVTATVNNFYDFDVDMLQASIDKALKTNQKVLPILINSYGGLVYNCLRMVDMLKASGLKIVTILNGYAMSSGAFLFAIGDERYMSENSTIMIHEASSVNFGKTSQMKAQGEHIQELNDKLFTLLDVNSKKELGFFQDLVSKNNNADLFLNSTQAKDYGLVTDIKIPSQEEIFNETFVARSPYENMRILAQYSYNESFEPKKPEAVKKVTNSIKNKGVKMDLKDLLESLTAEQKAPIEALQSQINAKDGEIATISNQLVKATNSLGQKETEIAEIKAAHDKKLSEIEASNDKSFLDGLKANFQLRQADYDEEIKVLASFGNNIVAKEAYKKKMSNAPKVVAGAIENHKEEQDFTAKGNDYASKLEVVAKKHGYDLKTVNGLQDAQLKLAESEGK